MNKKTGFIAYDEQQLMAWSMVLAMNEIVYFIKIDKVDGKMVYVLYIDKVGTDTQRFLERAYEMYYSCMSPVLVN